MGGQQTTPTFTIVRMTSDDVELATKVRLQSWLDTYVNDEAGVTREWIEARNQMQRSPEKVEAWQKRLSDPNVAGWVAKDEEGRVIGMATQDRDEKNVQHIETMYVDKAWHGKGCCWGAKILVRGRDQGEAWATRPLPA